MFAHPREQSPRPDSLLAEQMIMKRTRLRLTLLTFSAIALGSACTLITEVDRSDIAEDAEVTDSTGGTSAEGGQGGAASGGEPSTGGSDTGTGGATDGGAGGQGGSDS